MVLPFQAKSAKILRTVFFNLQSARAILMCCFVVVGIEAFFLSLCHAISLLLRAIYSRFAQIHSFAKGIED